MRARDVRRCVPPGGRGNVSAVFGGAVLAQITVQVLGDPRKMPKVLLPGTRSESGSILFGIDQISLPLRGSDIAPSARGAEGQ